MTDLAIVSGIAAALKSAFDLAKAALDVKGSMQARAKVGELERELAAARKAQLALSDDKADLEQKCVQLEGRKAKQERYELKAVDRRAFACVLKPIHHDAEPPHWACQPCLDKGEISLLQFAQTRAQTFGEGTQAQWACSACGHAIWVFYKTTPAAPQQI